MILGPSGARQRMEEIQQNIASFSPQPPEPLSGQPSFSSALSGAIGGMSPMDPRSATIGPIGNTSQYKEMAQAAAQKYGIDPKIFEALVQQESGWNPTIVSEKGATGLTQLMPDTAADLGVTDATEPAQALDGGAHFLRQMLDRFGNDYPTALAAYNAGPGAVEKAHGSLHYHQTTSYVQHIMKRAGR